MKHVCHIALVALSFGLSSAALAESWPAQPIRAYIPFGAGSATDIVPRTVFDAMSKELGQTITVENKGGAGGTIGIGVGQIISGDSLFSRHPGAGRVAVADMAARLAVAGGILVDAQWDSPFLSSLGAGPLPRERYLPLLARSAERVALPSDPLTARRLLART